MRCTAPEHLQWFPCICVRVGAGTSLRYRPGIIICGSGLVHDCGSSRSIGYFLEVLVLLALFAKRVSSSGGCSSTKTCLPACLALKRTSSVLCSDQQQHTTADFTSTNTAAHMVHFPSPLPACLPERLLHPTRNTLLPLPPTLPGPLQPLSITLRGITNDHVDPSIDTWRTVSLPLLRRAAGLDDAAAGGLELKVVRRGARPGGGGEVQLRVPLVRALPLVSMSDEGMVKRVRGIAYSMRVSWAR
jgi:RNA 3'-terminal phosphate cyclase